MAELWYPTDEQGLAIPPHEIGLPESRIPTDLLDEGEPYVNNHHLYYERCAWIGNAVLHKFRQLEENIVPLPIDEHRVLHQRYRGVQIPKLSVVMGVLEERYEDGGLIYPRHSTKKPRPITEADMRDARRDYNRIQRYERA